VTAIRSDHRPAQAIAELAWYSPIAWVSTVTLRSRRRLVISVAKANWTPGLAQLPLHGAGDGGEVDDAGVGGVQGRYAFAFRLDVADLARVDAAQAGDSVGVGALFEVG
jgi:hypothetical protein